MPEPLTDAYLAEIQARIDTARPGPWKATQCDFDGVPLGFGPFSWVEAWDAAEITPNVHFCAKARTDIPALLTEIARLRTRVAELESGAALAWAASLDADDLEGSLADLATAADGDDDLVTLAAVEKAIAQWRHIGEATQAQRTAQGPDGGAG